MTSHSTPRRVFPAPATLALLAAGCTVGELAQALGVSRSAASSYLIGRRPAPRCLPTTLRRVVGPQAAAAVLDAIPSTDHGAVAA